MLVLYIILAIVVIAFIMLVLLMKFKKNKQKGKEGLAHWEELCRLLSRSYTLPDFYQEISKFVARYYPACENYVYIAQNNQSEKVLAAYYMSEVKGVADTTFFRQEENEEPMRVWDIQNASASQHLFEGKNYYPWFICEQPEILVVYIGPLNTENKINTALLKDCQQPLLNYFKLLTRIDSLAYKFENAKMTADINQIVSNSFFKELSSPQNRKILPHIKEDFFTSLVKLVDSIEDKDPYFSGHSRRVAFLAQEIAKQMNLSLSIAEKIYRAGLLHDVGKSTTTAELMNKREALKTEEVGLLKMHPVVGAMVVKPLDTTDELTDMIKYHHERVDGYGYPDGLKGEQIPIGARILFLAENFDAMVNQRPYRPPFSFDKAMEMIKSEKGCKFDTQVVDAFTTWYQNRIEGLAPEMPVTHCRELYNCPPEALKTCATANISRCWEGQERLCVMNGMPPRECEMCWIKSELLQRQQKLANENKKTTS